MNITVKNADPKVAREIANEVPVVFGGELENREVPQCHLRLSATI